MGRTGTTEAGAGDVRKRRITLEDGRYLIFYTFDGGAEPGPPVADAGAKAEPVAQPVAEEERRV